MEVKLKDKNAISALYDVWKNDVNNDTEEIDKLEELYAEYVSHIELIAFATGIKYELKFLQEVNG